MRLLNNKWATLAGALAMTLALAACGGGSSPQAVIPDPPPNPGEERTAIQTAVGVADAALATVTDAGDAVTNDQIVAAENAVARVKAAIGAADDLSDDEIARYQEWIDQNEPRLMAERNSYDLGVAQMMARAAATKAREAATAARAAAMEAAGLQGPNSQAAVAADMAATAAETAATAAETAADAAEADTMAADAEAEQATAVAAQGTAEMKQGEAEGQRDVAQGGRDASDFALITSYREAAMTAKMDAEAHAQQARGKATMARQQATNARAAANKAMSARRDYENADKYAKMAEAAAMAAEAAATAAETAATAAGQAYMAAMAEDVSASDAKTARDTAMQQNGIASASHMGDMGAGAKYMEAKAAAMDADKYAGMNVLAFLQLLNGDDTSTAAAKKARLEAVNDLFSGRANGQTTDLANDPDNASAAVTATVTWNYHGSLGADGAPGGDDANADTKPGEGMIGVVLTTTPGLSLTRDDTTTAVTDETNFMMGSGLGDFAEYHITAGTGADAKTRAIVFTDKEQARKPVSSSVVEFSNIVPDVSRLSWDADAYDYDHDKDSRTDPIRVGLSCPTGTTCEVDRDNKNKVVSVTGYKLVSNPDSEGEPQEVEVAAVAEKEDMSYLAFGAWVSQAASNGDITFGAFANGSGTDTGGNQLPSVRATITGKASYKGKAAGVHNTPSMTNFFHADATLTADFGNATTMGTITGKIHNIMSGGDPVSDNIYLDRLSADANNINDNGTINGRARMGAATVRDTETNELIYPYNGVWQGRFYNAAPAGAPAGTPPMSAAGTFGVSHTDGMDTDPTDDDTTSSFVGAFGAHKQ